jgi:hypothetical protein
VDHHKYYSSLIDKNKIMTITIPEVENQDFFLFCAIKNFCKNEGINFDCYIGMLFKNK